MFDKSKRIVEIKIGFDVDDEKIKYIKSDFMNEDLDFKEPIEYTSMLLQLALETWIREKVGLFCPECQEEIGEDWIYCPKCGYSFQD
jgi:zinc-ribbon domain